MKQNSNAGRIYEIWEKKKKEKKKKKKKKVKQKTDKHFLNKF